MCVGGGQGMFMFLERQEARNFKDQTMTVGMPYNSYLRGNLWET
jgi:hypothetical protein